MDYVCLGLVTSWWFYLLENATLAKMSHRMYQQILWGVLGPKWLPRQQDVSLPDLRQLTNRTITGMSMTFPGGPATPSAPLSPGRPGGPWEESEEDTYGKEQIWTHRARSELSSPALRGLLEVLLVLFLQEALLHPAHRSLKVTAVVLAIPLLKNLY